MEPSRGLGSIKTAIESFVAKIGKGDKTTPQEGVAPKPKAEKNANVANWASEFKYTKEDWGKDKASFAKAWQGIKNWAKTECGLLKDSLKLSPQQVQTKREIINRFGIYDSKTLKISGFDNQISFIRFTHPETQEMDEHPYVFVQRDPNTPDVLRLYQGNHEIQVVIDKGGTITARVGVKQWKTYDNISAFCEAFPDTSPVRLALKSIKQDQGFVAAGKGEEAFREKGPGAYVLEQGKDAYTFKLLYKFKENPNAPSSVINREIELQSDGRLKVRDKFYDNFESFLKDLPKNNSSQLA